MSEELENSVREMLKAETWTRSGIGNFTVDNLNELSGILDKTHKEAAEDVIMGICDEQLQKTKDCVSALFIKGMLSLREQNYESKEIVSLIDIFEKNHKDQIIVVICNKILEEMPENIFALRKRAECYKENNDDRFWDEYKKIVQLDFGEADLALQLAEKYREDGNEKDEITYYKRAILRYISTASESATKNEEKIKTVWSKLVKLIPKEMDYFLMLQKKIAQNVSEGKSATLMMELYDYYADTSNWDVAISILKLVLAIDGKESSYRSKIVDCYEKKYSSNRNVKDYIKKSGLDKNTRDVFEAINDFEKHISFDKGNFVFHRSWGVGYIIKVAQGDDLTINFGSKVGNKSMKLDMAIKALQPLSKKHIWVLKATKSRDALLKMVGLGEVSKDLSKTEKDNAKRNAVAETLKIIIESFDNRCDMKRIKAELVPAIIDETKWNNWHAIANEILSAGSTSDPKSPNFGVAQDDINMYTVRENKLEVQERLNIEFKAEKDFFSKSDILMRLVDQYRRAKDEDKDKYLEPLTDMFSYFANYLKSSANEDDDEEKVRKLASFLLVQCISKEFPSFHIPEDSSFEKLYTMLSPRDAYQELQGKKNTNLRDYFLRNVKLLRNWDDEYVKLFPVVLDSNQSSDRAGEASYIDITKELADANKEDKLTQLVKDCFEDYRSNRNAAIFLFQEHSNDEWFKAAKIPYDVQLQTLLKIMDYCFWEISNHKDTTENKKTINAARNILFGKKKDDKNLVLAYIIGGDEDNALRFFTLVNDITGLDHTFKDALRNGILDKWKDFKFPVTAVKQASTQNGIWVTAKALEDKRAEAENIEKVILPKIVEEISEARDQGDLKENAEYKAAKEAQHINSKKLADLQKQIDRAVIFDPSTITTAIVSFGTKVTVHDNLSGQDSCYTILGPFESAPDKGIISYISPLGDKLMDSKVDEKLEFTINGKAYDYTIKSIEVANLS
ncbi:MAG: transcription elongation factor GreA [Treponema sp.]|nr:transcription elongation factor GreA [Treponema sp.]